MRESCLKSRASAAIERYSLCKRLKIMTPELGTVRCDKPIKGKFIRKSLYSSAAQIKFSPSIIPAFKIDLSLRVYQRDEYFKR